MAKCSTCQGTGYEIYDEDDRRCRSVCYHCGNTGEVDDETAFHDRLEGVAWTLAHQYETEYRILVNSDPEGDGYDLGGYENGLMPGDYFRARVWDRIGGLLEDLAKLPREMQEVLVVWNEAS